MPNFTLSEKQLVDWKHILSCDNAQLPDEPEFFEETGLDPKLFLRGGLHCVTLLI